MLGEKNKVEGSLVNAKDPSTPQHSAIAQCCSAQDDTSILSVIIPLLALLPLRSFPEYHEPSEISKVKV
jgi:hypothetical protein